MNLNPYVEAMLFFAIVIVARSLILKMVERLADEKQVDAKRLFYVKKAIDTLIFTIAFVVGLSYSGLGFNDLGVFFGSIIAVLGVSLFAQWSILSNATASVIVFFFFPYRVGDYVKILDGDNSIEGNIKEIALFHVIMADAQGDIVTFPNSMVFQKAIVIRKNQLNEEGNQTEDEHHE